MRLDDDSDRSNVEDRRGRGFNTLLVSVPDAYDPDGKATYPPDRYGHQAFEGEDWTRPVEAYWAHVDRVFRKAEEFPRTATGKLQKFKLREPYWAGRTRRVN